MPLHLLGKKSWNVYNTTNIERVRRDEAAAQAREEEAERRLDEVDAARRLAILRGERPPSPPPELLEAAEGKRSGRDGVGGERKRKRLAGEDDTDRDIRLAREMNGKGREMEEQLVKFSDNGKGASDAPLMDHAGHVNLFPVDPRAARKAEKNAEREAEERKKKQEFEDQYTMRFTNAAGREGLGKPWYASASMGSRESGAGALDESVEEPRKNVWGREDPGRKGRERMRMTTSDPLAFMKKAQSQLKDAERDRRRWAAEREREVLAMKAASEKEPKSERKRKHPRREGDADDVDDLEGFSLEAPAADQSKSRHEHRSRHRHDRRERSRSRDMGRHRSHRNRSRSRDGDRRRPHDSSEKRSRSREREHAGDGYRPVAHGDGRSERRRHE